MVADAADFDPATGQVDDEEDVVARQAVHGEDFDREEIARRDRTPMRAEKLTPAQLSLPAWCRLNAMFFEQLLNRGAADLVSQAPHDIAETRVAPAWVVAGDGENEVAEFVWLRRSARTTLGAAVVLGRNELAVPTQDRVWRDDTSETAQSAAPHNLALPGEAPTLRVGEAQAFAAEQFAQHTVLLLQVMNDAFLLAAQPARDHCHDEVPSAEFHAAQPRTIDPDVSLIDVIARPRMSAVLFRDLLSGHHESFHDLPRRFLAAGVSRTKKRGAQGSPFPLARID